jgi:hypothetical protein
MLFLRTRTLSIFLFILFAQNIRAQNDSITANYIQANVDRIEERLNYDMMVSIDTVISDPDGDITVHTDFYIDRPSGQIEKIIEKSHSGAVETEIIVYYRSHTPILFTSHQSQGGSVKLDFDIYYQNNNMVYVEKRKYGRGNPDDDEMLKWCYELLKSYKKTNKNL